jgi:capsular polysaccharide biosynthesis protein
MSPTKPRKVFLIVAILVFFTVFGLAAIITFMLPKTYSSTARVRLNSLPPQTDANAALTAEADAVQSEPVLMPVIESLKLRQLWGRKIRVDEELKPWEGVTLLRRHMEMTTLPETKELEIAVFDDDGDEAARIANRIAETLCGLPANSTRGLELSQRAEPAIRPVRPNVPLNLVLGAMGGLGIALAVGGMAGWIVMALGKGAPTMGGTT